MTAFASLADFAALLRAAPDADAAARAGAVARNGQLTKPPGALGRLEDLAIWVAGWQGRAQPRGDRPQVLIFAGNHGVVAAGDSVGAVVAGAQAARTITTTISRLRTAYIFLCFIL